MAAKAAEQGVKPWDALLEEFAATPVELEGLLESLRDRFPRVKESGVCYINFQKPVPTARAGTIHVCGLNPFSSACFSGNLYWDDLRLRVHEICDTGRFDKSLAITAVNGMSGLKACFH